MIYDDSRLQMNGYQKSYSKTSPIGSMYGILFSISMVDFDGKIVGKYTNHTDPMESRICRQQQM